MVLAEEDNKPIGFLSIKNHSEHCSEVYVMGVLKEFHGEGVGTALLNKAESLLSKNGIEFLQVKTLSKERDCPFYNKTRSFYQNYGFKDIEVFPTLWDKSNPCLLLLKRVENGTD